MDLMSTAQLLGNFGEFFGALLLVGSLIYVGAQIKQNTSATRAQVYQTRTGQAQDQFLWQINSPDLIGITNEIEYSDPENTLAQLSVMERQRFILFQTNALNRMDNLFYQYQNGFLDKEYYEDVIEHICRINAPLWKHLDIRMRRSFRREIDRIEAKYCDTEPAGYPT
jgi:hypothetical protein